LPINVLSLTENVPKIARLRTPRVCPSHRIVFLLSVLLTGSFRGRKITH
jgi:hypothetical protein